VGVGIGPVSVGHLRVRSNGHLRGQINRSRTSWGTASWSVCFERVPLS
jgi:hypothetical protein